LGGGPGTGGGALADRAGRVHLRGRHPAGARPRAPCRRRSCHRELVAMTATLALLLAFSVSGTVRSGAHALLDHFAEGGGGGSDTGKVRVLVQPQQAMAKAQAQADDDAEEGDSDADSDTDLEAVPPPPAPPRLPRIKIDL